MKDILHQIIDTKRDQMSALRARKPSLRQALLDSETGIIAEFKRRSPSKGWIKEEGRADIIPLAYQQNGATALSILTDEHYFGGSDDYIRTARQTGVTLPILYKNFVIDEAQLYAAALCGASAVLLIAACLSKQECKSLLHTAHELGLEVLLEMHSEAELEYAELCPDLCGINNRNLGSFVTDVDNSFRLAEKLLLIVGDASKRCSPVVGDASKRCSPVVGDASKRCSPVVGDASKRCSPVVGDASKRHDATPATLGSAACHPPVLVSESGISSPQTIRDLRQAGFRGFLIGETFMKTADPGLTLKRFIEQL